MKTFKYLGLSFIILLLFSCGKDFDNQVEVINQIPAAKEKVESTVYGIIFDENETPLANVSISIDQTFSETDEQGYFKISGLMDVEGAVIKIIKEGFYDGYGLIIPYKNSSVQMRMSMMKRENPDVRSSDTDIRIESSGSSVSFSQNSFKLAGNDYSGDVNIYSEYFDPTQDDISRFYIGGFETITSEGRQNIFSYGLFNVELESNTGQELDIDENATLRFSIPQDLIFDAPEEVSLWYPDENSGLWIEDGKASRESNEYVGQVTHFTTWCVGSLNPSVIISGTVSKNGSLVSNTMYRIRTNYNYNFPY